MLRGRWGLNDILFTGNQKERTDHRHHVVDALVIGSTTRGTLNKMARAAAQAEMPGWNACSPTCRRPGPSSKTNAARSSGGSTTSWSGTGRNIPPTAACMRKPPIGPVTGDDRDKGNVVVRKPVTALTEKLFDDIRDIGLREAIKTAVAQGKAEGRDLKKILADIDANGVPWPTEADPSRRVPVHRVRLLRREADEGLAWISDKNGRPYKAYAKGAIHRIEIYELPNGRLGPASASAASTPARRRTLEPTCQWRPLDHDPAQTGHHSCRF